jgi:uncharacterized membrane protein YeaQ/YmgE (transglycosylase-associated protein family)
VGIISWIVWGLFVGAIARLLLPGRQRLGVALTIVFGVAGSILGGLVATKLLGIGSPGDFDLGSFIVAVLASVGLIAVYDRIDRDAERRREKREQRAAR